VASTKQGPGNKVRSALCPFPVALSFVLVTLSLPLSTCLLSCSPGATSGNAARVQVQVKPGLGIRALADTLAAKQVIVSQPLFLFYSWYYNYASRIRPNRYHLPVGTGERRVLKLLSGEEPALVLVTIPEGYTMKQVAEEMERRGICRAGSFLAACADKDLLAQFGIAAPAAEGYLWPETYEFLTNSPSAEVVRRMLRQFFSVYAELLPPAPSPTSLVPSETVILASIVEREAKAPEEFPRIAGVFANRLRRGMPLQSCATVEYLLPERKGRLSQLDTKLDSPYNTYLHLGLPPGPICNPGRLALQAALAPERHDYLYFVSRGDGTHIFSRTLAEHSAACVRARGGS